MMPPNWSPSGRLVNGFRDRISMMDHLVLKLGFTRLLLVTVGLVAVAGPVAFGLASAPQNQAQPETESRPSGAERMTFEVASIKPAKPGGGGSLIRNNRGGRFTATNMSLKKLMRIAYNIESFQIFGGPSWVESDRYDIDAESERVGGDEAGKARIDIASPWVRLQKRLQSLLEDRCKLAIHRETKELPVYVLLVAKNGPKFQESRGTGGRLTVGMGRLTATRSPWR